MRKVLRFCAAVLLFCAPVRAEEPPSGPPEAAEKPAAEPGTGTLRGHITFKGETPKPFEFDVRASAADTPVCSGGEGHLKRSNRLLVDEKTRGVANVVVRLSTADGRAPTPSKPFPARHKPLLDQVHCEYVPFVTWVEAGQSLRIKSSDDTMHNVHAYKDRLGGETLFNVAMPRKDRTITKRFEDAGLAVLGCDAGHVWMNAYVFIVDQPYIELSSEDGAYEMAGIPPGTYAVRFWQAGWEVTAGAPDPKTGKPGGYTFAQPLEWDTTVEIKAGENTLNATLTPQGWTK